MNPTQSEKALRFRALHQKPGVFFIPNPWDVGSARILSQLGFEALATSSAASAAVFGRRDGEVMRFEALAHAENIVSATALPVSADLENGFSDDPDGVADTVRLAGNLGLAGCSIEDATRNRHKPIYDIRSATERIAAAAEAARSFPFPFTLTARSENFVRGISDLDDTIKRLVSYEKAGADVLFAPGLPDLAAVRAICSAVSKPVNFMVGVRGKSFTAAALGEAGVKRISFASSLYRAAMTHLINVASEVKKSGAFNYLDETITTPDLYKFFPD
jgi:2-methylisocitrate lyase-like PEP mutase family enzyme